MKTLRAILVVLALFAFVFGIFNAAEYPASPLVVTMLALPFYLMSFKVRQGEERRTAGAKRRLRGIQRYNKQPFARRFAPRYSKNNIPYRLSSRNSFSSSLRSSHIQPFYITNSLALVASLIAASETLPHPTKGNGSCRTT